MLHFAFLAIAATALAVPSDDEASQAAQLVESLETSPNPYLAEEASAAPEIAIAPTSPAILRQNLCPGDRERGGRRGYNDCYYDGNVRPPVRRPYRGSGNYHGNSPVGPVPPAVEGEPDEPAPLTPERVVHTFTKAHTKTQTSTDYFVETEYRTRTVTDTLYHTNTSLHYPEQTYTLTGYDTFYEYPGFTQIGGTHRADHEISPIATPATGSEGPITRPVPVITEAPIYPRPYREPHRGDLYRGGAYRGEPYHYRGGEPCDDRIPPRRERERDSDCGPSPAPRRHRWFGRRRGSDCD